jgi:hypothetical protein
VNTSTGLSPLFALKAGQIKLTINSGIRTSGILAVNLMSFSGISSGNNNLLYWSAANETNAERFELEYSPDGQRFNKAGDILAAGTTNTRTDYSFTHLNPGAGKLYYRLKIVDRDEKFVYSKIIVLTHVDKKLFVISTYPNPVKDKVTADVFVENGGMLSLYFTNSNGLLVKSATVHAVKGINHVPLENLGQFTTGIYFLKISNDVNTAAIQILKSN